MSHTPHKHQHESLCVSKFFEKSFSLVLLYKKQQITTYLTDQVCFQLPRYVIHKFKVDLHSVAFNFEFISTVHIYHILL